MLGEGKGKTEGCVQTDLDVGKKQYTDRRKRQHSFLLLFTGFIAFKLACDAGFLWLSTQDAVSYPLDFSIGKYLFGFVCCVAVFFFIEHNERRASSFFLYFVFLIQIVPITSSYALANRSTEFYSVLILAFALCCLIVGKVGGQTPIRREPLLSNTVYIGFAGIMMLIVLLLFLRFGMPSLAALDIYSVYELRESGEFTLGKYENYLFSWTTAVILPAGIALSIVKRKYIIAGVLSGLMLVLYLYSGHKTFLFSIPLVLICAFWSRRKHFYKELFVVLCFGFAILVLLLWFSPIMKDLIQKVFSLFARRVMYVPANNKFHYFDYFSNNPKMGIGGIIPRWLFYVPNYYENIPYSFEISAIYYNKPDMNSNTGFLAEGFMRFGHIGTFLVLLVFAWILKMIDRFQGRVGYELAIGVFVYQIYSLSDAHLIDSMVLGPWMLLIIILLLCGSQYKPRSLCQLQVKQIRLLQR